MTENLLGWFSTCSNRVVLHEKYYYLFTFLMSTFLDCRCAESRTNCDACQVRCSRNMQSHQGSHRCNITGEDADNGESPRLQHCFSCCGKQNCKKDCEVYHNPDCEPIR